MALSDASIKAAEEVQAARRKYDSATIAWNAARAAVNTAEEERNRLYTEMRGLEGEFLDSLDDVAAPEVGC